MSQVRTAVVIGGGIAGPVTALALRKAGIDVSVHERYESSAEGLGGTIALAPNGLAALGIVGAAAAVVAGSQPGERQVMSIGRRRVALPGLADQGPLHVVRRGDLYRILRQRLAEEGVPVTGGRRLTAVRERTAIFEDGSEASADVLIGADGVHSAMRRLIDPDAPSPRYTGLLAFEGLSAAEVDAAPGTMTFAFGRRAYYLYWPAPGGGTTFGINLPRDRPLSTVEARTIPDADWMRTLRTVYADDDPGAELLARTSDLQVNGALFIMPPVPRWHRDRMVLVGDAVHAPSNTSGQGASLAVESAVELARCLRDAPGFEQAFLRYESLRRRRVERIAAQAARVNHAKIPGPVVKALLPMLIPLFMSPERTLGPVQRYRIDWDQPALR
ncbi:FAD-dependent monooxygenase [Actinoplanes sp. Pm04-4]|uniref:FAD-dependent monooxygenase n=1 Tax=Paractinoplanes pyxinae TaxID=2997416 RepID=A0ABT4B6R1_9ACTN|nr:FAD-dependent monooxygenase [Actinoplanes pyxinae]MCY1142187.1 FAD-dependent monooxygenase [Actinoplanes pyxinae]